MTTQRLSTPFGAKSTAAEVIAGVDLTGRSAIVTGAASGIGIETARALANAGAHVTLAVRDLAAGGKAAGDIGANTRVASLDLSDRASIAAFANAWQGPLHILVNNAGVMACPETRTREGWELQFATNHLGHFALALALRPALAAARGARIVSVSSGGHLVSPVVFEDIHFERRPYQPWPAYGQSKTANVLFAVEANRRFVGDGIVANALMPGAIRSNLQRHLDTAELDRMEARISGSPDFDWKSPEQGAATSVLLAASPLVDGIGGRYFEDCNEAEPNRAGSRRGVAAYAVDPDNAARLWETSITFLRT
jgi:NAD(P)-dependent dehydrogenase (short-subunit alcohol dehydrogenase family)